MTPIRFYVVPREDVEHITSAQPLPGDFVQEWERSRRGVLNDTTQDIFSPNIRSRRQKWKNFKLFRQVTSPTTADVVVCQNWLELFHSNRLDQSFRLLLQHMILNYPGKIKAISWNHDFNSRHVPMFADLPDDLLIIDYNTSEPWPQSVVVPFWNVSTKPPVPSRREYLAGFVGYVGSVFLRQSLEQSFRHKAEYYWSRGRMDEDEFIELLGKFHYAICPRGGGLSSYRFYEAIQCGTVPVLFADDASLPFPDLDYRLFSIQMPENMSHDFHAMDEMIRAADWQSLHENAVSVQQTFSLQGVQHAVYDRIVELLL